MPHASMRDYVIGFILSVTLTAIPFWLVMTMPLSAGATGAIIMGFAVVQIVVHMVYFLHMTPKRSEEHTSELQSLMRISYAVFCLKKNTPHHTPLPPHITIIPKPHTKHQQKQLRRQAL